MTTTMYAELVNAVRRPKDASPTWQPEYAYPSVTGSSVTECYEAAEKLAADRGGKWRVLGISETPYAWAN